MTKEKSQYQLWQAEWLHFETEYNKITILLINEKSLNNHYKDNKI